MTVRKKQVASAGLQQLLSRDPSRLLLYAAEQAAERSHPLRLPRVLKQLRRRSEKIGWFHASEIADPAACSRYLAARLLGYQFREHRLPQQQRILDNGTFMHLRWQNYFLSLPPRFNAAVGVELAAWPILGEADALIDHPEFGGVVILELKSMRSDAFQRLSAELPAHRRQTQMYMGLRGAQSGQVWYENKDNQDVKTFNLGRRDATYRRARERALELAGVVVAGRLPPPCEQDCRYDERIGRLEVDERRWDTLREEMAAHA